MLQEANCNARPSSFILNKVAFVEFLSVYKASLDNPELVIFNICLLAKQSSVYILIFPGTAEKHENSTPEC